MNKCDFVVIRDLFLKHVALKADAPYSPTRAVSFGFPAKTRNVAKATYPPAETPRGYPEQEEYLILPPPKCCLKHGSPSHPAAARVFRFEL
jgi:hypothetical protein